MTRIVNAALVGGVLTLSAIGICAAVVWPAKGSKIHPVFVETDPGPKVTAPVQPDPDDDEAIDRAYEAKRARIVAAVTRGVPAPAGVQFHLPEKHRDRLRPCVRQLLADIETGIASGAPASKYKDCMDVADAVDEGKAVKRYVFNVSKVPESIENAVIISFTVYKSTDRVVYCDVIVPDF